ncbi:BREX-1 system adenine-specific DNA-methyltransferase PglX [Fibrobacter sp. UWB7]|uniref:BREX-1 system adenine-specific DNA-methyltransferase PglX n=1 Tax=Fibrobacter sp. UWB7 TaxID=1896206 RepID=UPI0009137DB7|nr:BREX-1 system adenine-specific DNA-methyltransferase PglX [Fibrobacter sp. UWB7]SHM74909.1 N-6 DNA Methylase [Fibrobacter sp. UWB7]
MDTSRLKKFATEARSNLIKGVVDRLKMLGFDEKGHVEDSVRPEKLQGGILFRGKLKQGYDFYNKWIALESTIKNHPKGAKVGIKHVAEEAAYTWFNRFVAIRILQKNRLIEPQLAYAEGGRIPLIVENARQGRLPTLDETERAELDALLDDDSKVLEQFTVLIVAYCHTTPILLNCFGHIDDYTELLLPTNILAAGGFIDLLNTTDYITDKDFKQTELIGWLYQFYISEKKDEVFASFKNKKKAEAEDIPAATQIFTPNWIVKYMVQNTLGRIYLDNNPGSDLAKDWKYLVDTPTASDSIYRYAELESLKVADFASGSGHILNEFFDMLYSFYMDEGSSPAQAIESIFKHNLIGIDLDTRAKQLSMFSLLLKACQKNARFVDAKVLPRVYDMPDPITDKEWLRETLPHYFLGGTDRVIKESTEALKLMESAKNLGSTMVFKISTETRNAIAEHIDIWKENGNEDLQNLVRSFRIILALTDKYSAIAMNPPYMGNGNMNAELSDYIKKNYPNSKADLFSVFMDVAIDRLASNAKYAMINMHSWMFLSSFENLRKDILEHYSIDSMMHLGPRTFDELSGEVVQNTAYVVSNRTPQENESGTYFRLVDGKDCSDKERMFLDGNDNHTDYVYYSNISQSNFEKIPSSPIGYWVGDKVRQLFAKTNVESIAFSDGKNVTGDNDRFLRFTWEVDFNRVGKGCKWMLQTKGGEARRWYGNTLNVIAWSPEDIEFYHRNKMSRVIKEYLWYKEGVTWSKICSGKATFRFLRVDSTYDEVNVTPYEPENIYGLLGCLNSKVTNYLLDIINPTFSVQTENVLKIPFYSNQEIESLVKSNFAISKSDWDAYETSWDFQKNELLAMTLEDEDANVQFDIDEAAKCGKMLCIDRAAPEPESLSWRMRVYQGKWERLFKQLHANEEELNRQFIEIYGLQDELTPDVPLDEVTILQQGEISIGKPADCNMSCDAPLVDYEQIEWHEDVVIKQFISYAVGCIMGRYRLDKPGLAIAHPNATAEEIAPYTYNGETFKIDDDGIIPLMSKDSAFPDNAVNRFTDFLRIAFGSEKLTENLNYVEKCLGKSIEDYLYKNFWDDHKKMYQNRPIYWLFSSKKGAFKCIVYMHRMDAYTAELVRKNYLLSHLDYLRKRIAGLEADELNLSSADNRMLKKLRDHYDECLEYDGRLQRVASEQIAFDLDDGVVVNYAKFGDVLAKIK